MRILRMTMSHSQIQKKNNFQPEDQISTVYKNSSFQPEHYFLGRGFFILMILFFKHRLTRAHREKQLKMSCQALHNAPPNRT